jgi:hypothetical protein
MSLQVTFGFLIILFESELMTALYASLQELAKGSTILSKSWEVSRHPSIQVARILRCWLHANARFQRGYSKIAQ